MTLGVVESQDTQFRQALEVLHTGVADLRVLEGQHFQVRERGEVLHARIGYLSSPQVQRLQAGQAFERSSPASVTGVAQRSST